MYNDFLFLIYCTLDNQPNTLLFLHNLRFDNRCIMLKRTAMRKLILLFVTVFVLWSCQTSTLQENNSNNTILIDESLRKDLIDQMTETFGSDHQFRIERGVNKTASLWRESDGTKEDFKNFCMENFIADPGELDIVFNRLEENYKYLYGYLGRIYVELNRQIHEDRGEVLPIDRKFGAYNAGSHIEEDFFKNKIAFIVTLNFPHYTLEEKNTLGKNWTPREWGYARLGDYYSARIPPEIIQENTKTYSEGRLYISEYNIFAGQLINDKMEQPFPEGMKLLAHWNIRDEIKSNYGQPNAFEKQQLLYNVMLRIIDQQIPLEVINNEAYQWDPINNKLYENGEEREFRPENERRYQVLLNNFKSMQKIDPYYQDADTYIKRRFDSGMEISLEEVKNIFTEYASSPLLKEVATVIENKLGRELQPFDLWFNGFSGMAGLPEDDLTSITQKRYPNAAAMDAELPDMLTQLGFSNEEAIYFGDHIDVDDARGSGHAMGASMPGKPSHLRTRIGDNGMDYKGYNIAIHEFGHNVEQTLSIDKVDNYFINGVPNVGFTEAIAFMFQSRDLELLGIDTSDKQSDYLGVLDVFWDNYEMMGVSLVDMYVWQWMYDNPEASASQLKEAVIRIAKEVWNEYYADVFGVKDIPLLAIYSHMIQSPLYLMNYPYGRLIMFQLEDYMKDKDFADEIMRIYSMGRLTPQIWMEKATGVQISNKPIFEAVEQALENV